MRHLKELRENEEELEIGAFSKSEGGEDDENEREVMTAEKRKIR